METIGSTLDPNHYISKKPTKCIALLRSGFSLEVLRRRQRMKGLGWLRLTIWAL